jgi:hypothetical protein
VFYCVSQHTTPRFYWPFKTTERLRDHMRLAHGTMLLEGQWRTEIEDVDAGADADATGSGGGGGRGDADAASSGADVRVPAQRTLRSRSPRRPSLTQFTDAELIAELSRRLDERGHLSSDLSG